MHSERLNVAYEMREAAVECEEPRAAFALPVSTVFRVLESLADAHIHMAHR